jgi:nicotinate phosphoribosyltransferase
VHDDESIAFERFAQARPENLTLLTDTYDTAAAAAKIVALAPRLKNAGITVHAVRLDSGDLVALSKQVRAILAIDDRHDFVAMQHFQRSAGAKVVL